MVTFYRPATQEAREKFASVVWNPQANAALADFTLAGGKFDTDDPKVIAKLREMGYPEVPQKKESPEPVTTSPTQQVYGGPDGPLEAKPVRHSSPAAGKASPAKPKLKSRKTTPPKPDGMDSDVSPR